MKPPRLPNPPFWTVDALASNCAGAWNLHPHCILAYAEAGTLSLTVNADDQLGITAEEKARFEGAREPQEKRYNPTERDTHLLLIGAFAVGYSGGEASMLDEPGRLITDLEKCAAANGAPMPRSYDTNTNALKRALELLRLNGYRPAARMRSPLAVTEGEGESIRTLDRPQGPGLAASPVN